MENTRRSFLKKVSAAGIGAAGFGNGRKRRSYNNRR